jgi:hypothetical protein
LGNGTFEWTNGPVRVGVDTDWVAIVAGANQSLARKRAGSLWVRGLYQPTPLWLGIAVDRLAVHAAGASDEFDNALAGVKTDGSPWFRFGTSISEGLVRGGEDTEWRTVVAKNNLVALKTDGSLWILNANDPLPRVTRRFGIDTDWGSPQ